MNKVTGLVVLIVGCILLYYGWKSHESVASVVSSSVSGTPTNKSLWLLALGLLAAIAGLFETLRGKTH